MVWGTAVPPSSGAALSAGASSAGSVSSAAASASSSGSPAGRDRLVSAPAEPSELEDAASAATSSPVPQRGSSEVTIWVQREGSSS